MANLYLIQVGSEWSSQFQRTVAEPLQISGEDVPADLTDFEELRIWGSTETERKRTHFDQMNSGDILLFQSDGVFFAGGRVGRKFVGSEFGEWIWDNRESSLVFTIDDYTEFELSREEVWELLGYKSSHRQQKSLVKVSEGATSNLLRNYNSLEEAYQAFRNGGSETSATEQEIDGDSSEEEDEARLHTEIQWYLIRLGIEHDYRVYVAKNDQNRRFDGHRFGDKCVDSLNLSGFSKATMDIIEYIDVVWMDGDYIVKMFEIESTTSIYSGILRMSDFVVKVPNLAVDMCIVAPTEDKDRVRKQMNRPTFQKTLLSSSHCSLQYISFDEVQNKYDLVEQAGPLKTVF